MLQNNPSIFCASKKPNICSQGPQLTKLFSAALSCHTILPFLIINPKMSMSLTFYNYFGPCIMTIREHNYITSTLYFCLQSSTNQSSDQCQYCPFAVHPPNTTTHGYWVLWQWLLQSNIHPATGMSLQVNTHITQSSRWHAHVSLRTSSMYLLCSMN